MRVWVPVRYVEKMMASIARTIHWERSVCESQMGSSSEVALNAAALKSGFVSVTAEGSSFQDI